MNQILNFNTIKTIIEVEGILTNESPMRIGKGAGILGEVDLPIEKDINDIPYIPGSSIKGSIRALCEAIARASGYHVCDPLNPKSICSISTNAIKRAMDLSMKGIKLKAIKNEIIKLFKENQLIHISKNIESREFSSVNDLINYLTNNYGPCIVCRIFGNTEIASHIIFYDVYPIVKDLRPLSRTRVAIDRFRGASRAGALFTYEYIPKGYEWSFKIRIINIDLIEGKEPEAKLLRSLMRYLCLHGVQVGGMKTIGHGLIKIRPEKTNVRKCVVENLEIRCMSYNLAEVLKRW